MAPFWRKKKESGVQSSGTYNRVELEAPISGQQAVPRSPASRNHPIGSSANRVELEAPVPSQQPPPLLPASEDSFRSGSDNKLGAPGPSQEPTSLPSALVPEASSIDNRLGASGPSQPPAPLSPAQMNSSSSAYNSFNAVQGSQYPQPHPCAPLPGRPLDFQELAIRVTRAQMATHGPPKLPGERSRKWYKFSKSNPSTPTTSQPSSQLQPRPQQRQRRPSEASSLSPADEAFAAQVRRNYELRASRSAAQLQHPGQGSRSDWQAFGGAFAPASSAQPVVPPSQGVDWQAYGGAFAPMQYMQPRPMPPRQLSKRELDGLAGAFAPPPRRLGVVDPSAVRFA